MSKLTDMLNAVGVRNPYVFHTGDTPAAQVYIDFNPATSGMAAMSAYWTVVRVGYKSDPNAGWPDYKHKRFVLDTHTGSAAERKAAALALAQAWASKRYGITDWKRGPFGSYGSGAFIDARVAELQAQADAQGYVPQGLKVYGWTGHRSEARMDRNHHGQTDEVVAAKSKAEAGRIAGLASVRDVYETGEAEAVKAALAQPGVLLWAPLHGPERGQFRPAGQVAA